MLGFLGKIFVCMLLVPVLARGDGLLLEATLSDKRPQSVRTLAMVMPAMAKLAGIAFGSGGSNTVDGALRASGDLVRLLPPAANCMDARPGSVTTVVPVGNGARLGAVAPPRPLVLGIVPATWWFLLPWLELLCCGAVSFFLARYLAGPTLRTRNAVVAFAAGDMAARAAPSPTKRRCDEAADLEREFNGMADRVGAMMAAQQRFIGDVSHEIRSPLAQLGLVLGLVRREAAPALLPRLDRMEQELECVTELVHELLVLATLQGSVGPPASELIDLQDMLVRVVDDLAFEFHDRTHGIRTISRDLHVVAKGDAALLRRRWIMFCAMLCSTRQTIPKWNC